VKVGDLVRVSYNTRPKPGEGYISIVLAICTPEMHRNGMHLIKILEHGQAKWYPVGYIEVINENRRSGENKI
jgi:hypothetical protein